MTPPTRCLLDLLRPDGAPLVHSLAQTVTPYDWEAIVSRALDDGVAPLLHRSLKASGALSAPPAALLERLEEDRHATALANLRHCAAFRDIARALGERHIPLIALKGLHLAEWVYRDISLRRMGDVDILVPRADVGAALATLQQIGYGPEADMRGTTEALLETAHAVGLVHRRLGNVVELHWTIGEPGYGYEPPVAEIWKSAAPGRLANADAQVMSPEFVLLHVCAHLACNHTFLPGLYALCDIAEIARATPALDWEIVIDQGRRHGWQRGIAAALQLSRDHLGAAVPDEVLAALGADVLAPDMLGEAMEHLLSHGAIPADIGMAPNFLAFVERRSLAAKLALLWQRVFMPRAELALEYGVSLRSPRLIFYYAVRVRDLIRKYAARAWAIQTAGPESRESFARHARLANWLAGSR